MRHDKEYVFTLRKEGKSYKEIQKITGISRGTLSNWFRNETWSKHLATMNTKRTRSIDHIKMMQSARASKLVDFYRDSEDEAVTQYGMYKNEPLFWAGLMAYAGEGDKRTVHLVRISNSEFYLHRIFMLFATQYLGIKKDRIKFGLIVYPDQNESFCKEMWANLLAIKRENFHKTQVMQGKEKLRRLQYGVGMTIISSTVLKKKLLKWLSLAQDERFEKAGMV